MRLRVLGWIFLIRNIRIKDAKADFKVVQANAAWAVETVEQSKGRQILAKVNITW